MTEHHESGESIWGDLPSTAFIQNSHLFKSLDDEGRKLVLKSGRLYHCAEREVIVTEGEPGDSFYIIKRGEVIIETVRDGATVELNRLKRGAVFGEVAVLTGMPRTATVRAADDETEVIEFHKDAIDRILESYPKVKQLLNAIMAGRVKDVIEKTIPSSSRGEMINPFLPQTATGKPKVDETSGDVESSSEGGGSSDGSPQS